MPFKDGIWYDEEPTPTTPTTPEAKPITKSILLTVKKMLGIAEEYHAFDIDVITNINAVFLTLNQLGVGPRLPYQITGTEETWSDFLGDQDKFMAAVQTYTYMKVRLMFDPPTNSFLVNSFEKQIEEFEWRFTIQPKNDDEVAYVESFSSLFGKNNSNQNGSSEPEEEVPVNTELTVMKASLLKAEGRKISPMDIFS